MAAEAVPTATPLATLLRAQRVVEAIRSCDFSEAETLAEECSCRAIRRAISNQVTEGRHVVAWLVAFASGNREAIAHAHSLMGADENLDFAHQLWHAHWPSRRLSLHEILKKHGLDG